MRKIPPKMRLEMAEDIFYKKCCLTPYAGQIIDLGGCEGRIEWHHNLIYGGRQVNEPFCILPICHKHHMMADKKDVKELLNYVMLSRATQMEMLTYSKAVDYRKLFFNLSKKYGEIPSNG